MSCSTLDPALIQGVVLAGAYPNGRSLFDRLRPRSLLPVAQDPLIDYPLRWLAEAGAGRATVCANSAARSVRDCLRDEPDLPAQVDFYEDWIPRGTAGCVRDVGLRTGARTLVVVESTTIPCADLRDVLATHETSGAALTVVAHRDGGPASSRCALTPCGIYVFDRRAIAYVSERGFNDIKETLIPRLHAAGDRLEVYVVAHACPSVLDAETYLAVNDWMISRVVGSARVPRGYRAADEALVHSSAQVAPGARMVGPLVLGPGVVVEDGATLVGPTAMGTGCRVGRGAVVSRSVAWSHCWMLPESLVDHCLLSDNAVVAPGASLYNTLKTGRLDHPALSLDAAGAKSSLTALAGPVPTGD